MNESNRPNLNAAQVGEFVFENFRLRGALDPLPGERDQNFRLTTDEGAEFVVKISHPQESKPVLDMQGAVLNYLASNSDADVFPRMEPSISGDPIILVAIGQESWLVRLVSYLPGQPLAKVPVLSPKTLFMLGICIGKMDKVLSGFSDVAMHHEQAWDTKHALRTIDALIPVIHDAQSQALVRERIESARSRIVAQLFELPMQVIHNDLNDYNVLVDGDQRITGLIDFGDMVHSYRICDLAHSLAYLILDREDWGRLVKDVVDGFLTQETLTPSEINLLPDFIQFRLCLSVCMAASSRQADPDNEYLSISEAPAWAALERFEEGRREIVDALVELRGNERRQRSKDEMRSVRESVLSPSLSIAYLEPLKIVRGERSYLFDEAGTKYLDCVNNVCHVGHCHPHVVAAGSRQMARLNTNTRYLHDNIINFAERLTSMLPDKLQVCFFVNSGSEANELALRLARTHTGAEDMIVVDHSYHGNTQATIDVSPYKFDGVGGRGAPEFSHKVLLPDGYRGPYLYDCPDAGQRYAESVADVIDELQAESRSVAGFISESILGVAGQIEFPAGYLAEVYSKVRAAGGVCIADEVQVGFGRVGTHMWAFETQGVVPDIVTLGKPIGNGHPLAAVVTTAEIAQSFKTGMEYFNTFGGNPVSCAIGMAVLDVIEDEGLQEHARILGAYFKEQLQVLAKSHEIIGDVRGRGLFLGFELVRDRETKEPAALEAKQIVEMMKDRHILVTSEGPFDCVIKMKPPMVFSYKNVDEFIRALDESIQNLS
ncbi:MAG: 4-aminobutyrate aminotransferase-like enzyme/Ser/Thr protein kinase RdoA (MazF antagonist) [Planctomycetota bacterium]|jgi:4-aminobutyrate aminotransferase-like enzyme/Ser/Thr protein kinase RdoA (MazF antagonist)